MGVDNLKWAEANAYTMAFNKNRGRGKYGAEDKTQVNATNLAPSDFAVSEGVEAENPATYEAPPGEYHPEAQSKGGKSGSVAWVSANNYVLKANAEAGRSKFAGEDKTHYGGVQESTSCLPPASLLAELSPCDFPVGANSAQVIFEQTGAPAGEFHPEAEKPEKKQVKGKIAWAEANQYVWAANQEAGRANKLPAYVYRAWQKDAAVAAH